MTSIREQIADKIRADAQAAGILLDVYPFGYDPEELRRPAVAVFRETVAQEPASLEHGFIIQVFGVQGVATQKTEDALDTLLDAVLVSLRRLDVVAFKEAKRQVLGDQFQGWEITVTWSSVDYIKQNAY